MKKIWYENSGSIVLTFLFAAALAGHAFTGFVYYNEKRSAHGQEAVALNEYLKSGDFIETVFENWESEFLQMGLYVALTIFLRQKGSSESKKLHEKEEEDEDPNDHRNDPGAPWPVKRGGWILRLYSHSLTIALFLLFVVSGALHAVGGAKADCEELRQHGDGKPCVSAVEYVASARFWFESFQNWQSEFLSVVAILVLSIHLRQKGSPESKPVHAPHSHTGR